MTVYHILFVCFVSYRLSYTIYIITLEVHIIVSFLVYAIIVKVLNPGGVLGKGMPIYGSLPTDTTRQDVVNHYAF